MSGPSEALGMRGILDFDRYPLDQPHRLDPLVQRCRAELARDGMYNLEGLVRPEAIARAAAEVGPRAATDSYTHARTHNVYFRDRVEGLEEGHPALARFQTINHTLCGDQLADTIVGRIYEYRPLVDFIARTIDVPRLYLMDDPLARANVMEYRPGEALNWHFDRARYTTTLLIQSAQIGGEFEYASGLRSDEDENYDGVGRFLGGDDGALRINPLTSGTLNVFAGRNTLHRVSTVEGSRSRLVAVFSYYDRPGVRFSDAERLGFYGRIQPLA
jgi:hypothetical protein